MSFFLISFREDASFPDFFLAIRSVLGKKSPTVSVLIDLIIYH